MTTTTVSAAGGFEGSNISQTIDTSNGGVLSFSYEMFTIPDKFEIRIDGKSIFSTAFVSGFASGTKSIPIDEGSNLTIIIATDNANTGWEYAVVYEPSPCPVSNDDARAELEEIKRLEKELGAAVRQADQISLLEAEITTLKGLTYQAYGATALQAASIAGQFAQIILNGIAPGAAKLVSTFDVFVKAFKSVASSNVEVGDAVDLGYAAWADAASRSAKEAVKTELAAADALKAIAEIGLSAVNIAQWQAELAKINKSIVKLEKSLETAFAAQSKADQLFDQIVELRIELNSKYHQTNGSCAFDPGGGIAATLANEDLHVSGAEQAFAGGAFSTADGHAASASAAPLALITVDHPFSNGVMIFGADGADDIVVPNRNSPITLDQVGGGEGIRITTPDFSEFGVVEDLDDDGMSDLALVGYDSGAGQFSIDLLLSGLGGFDNAGVAFGAFDPDDITGSAGVFRIAGPGFQPGIPASWTDVDGDGYREFVFVEYDGANSIYKAQLISDVAALAPTADAADGSADGMIDSAILAASAHFTIESTGSAFHFDEVGDLNGNGRPDLAIFTYSAVYVVFDDSLSALDAADGVVDDIGNVAYLDGTTGLAFYAPTSALVFGSTGAVDFGDINGDGFQDLVVGGFDTPDGTSSSKIFLGNASGFASHDAADGALDGFVNLEVGPAPDLTIVSDLPFSGSVVSVSSDLDGDGTNDLYVNDASAQAAYLIFGGAQIIADLDAADGSMDGRFNVAALTPASGYKVRAPSLNFDNNLVGRDFGGDGQSDLILPRGNQISILAGGPTSLTSLDAADGAADGVIDLAFDEISGFKWTIRDDAAGSNFINRVSSLGDLNGDGDFDLGVTVFAPGGGTALTVLHGGGSGLTALAGEGVTNVVQDGLGDDSVVGTAASEFFLTGEGNDLIDGGGGSDTALIPGNYGDHSVMTLGATTTVTDLIDGGVTTLQNIEYLEFSDHSLVIGGDLFGADPVLAIIDADAAENDAGGGFRFSLSHASASPITISYRAIPETGDASDIDTADLEFVIAPGVTQGVLPVGIVNDVTGEGPETFTLEILELTGVARIDDPSEDNFSDLAATLTIIDDDNGAPALSIEVISPIDPQINQDVTFEFIVSNNGTEDATGVVLSASISGFSPSNVEIDIGSIAPGQSVSVFAAGQYQFASDTAVFVSLDYDEQALAGAVIGSNSVAVQPIDPDPADLSVAMQNFVLTTTGFDFSAQASNAGPGIVTGVLVTFELPAGATVQSASSVQGSFDLNLDVWDVGNMRDLLNRSLQVSVDVADGVSGALIATGAGFEIDPDGANNSSNGYYILSGDGGGNPLTGGTAHDLIFAKGGDDVVVAAAGDDSVHGDAGSDTLDGGEGNDSLEAWAGRDFLLGANGDDILLGFGSHDSLYGGNGDDDLRGGHGKDLLNGSGDNDLVRGFGGDDRLFGGGGNDTLLGNEDHDSLIGGGGADRLKGDAGNDTLVGSFGADTVSGGAGSDEFFYRKTHGADVFDDLAGGAGAGDVIRLVAFGPAFDTFAEVIAAASDDGTDTTIDFGGGDMLILEGVLVAELHADDFAFG